MTGSSTVPTVLITGAGRGVGRAIAVELGRAGARVALVARSADELDETAELVGSAGGRALTVRADLSDPDAARDVVGRVHDELGTVEVLVNNAGMVAPLGATAELDPADWARALTVNLTAPVALTIAVLPGMLERRHGRVVNVSSGVVSRPESMVRGNAYVTTKTALEAHTLNLAAELDGSGVTVNVYRPGMVDTAMQGYIRAQDPARIGAGLHERFVGYRKEDMLITPEASAGVLARHLRGSGTGQIWTSADPV